MATLTNKRASKIISEQEGIKRSVAQAISSLQRELDRANAFGSWAFNSLLSGSGEIDGGDLLIIKTEFAEHAPQIAALCDQVNDMGSIEALDGNGDFDAAATRTNLDAHIAKYSHDVEEYSARFNS